MDTEFLSHIHTSMGLEQLAIVPRELEGFVNGVTEGNVLIRLSNRESARDIARSWSLEGASTRGV